MIAQQPNLADDEAAEKNVLAALWCAPEKVADLCSRQLRADMFRFSAHGVVYELLLEFAEQGKSAEFHLFKTAARGRLKDLVEDVPQFLNGIYSLLDVEKAIQDYIDIVLEKWRDRQLVELGRKVEAGEDGGEILERLQAIDQNQSGYPEIESADSFLEEDIPEPRELIRGLIHQGSKVTLGGCSKSYKTFSLTDLAVSQAAGVRWLGCDATAAQVLYVNLEIQRAFYQKRLKAICSAKGLQLNGDWRKNLDVWHLRGYCIDAESLCKRLRRLSGKGYALIIIDPLYKIIGDREENSNDQQSQLLNMLEQVAGETGAAVAYGQHFSKGNQAAKESIDRISGAGVFARDPDTIITLTALKEDNSYAVQCTLRNFAPVKDFAVRWQYPLFVVDDALDPGDLKKPAGRKEKWTVDQLVKCLGNKDLSSTEFRDLVASEIGMPKTNFYELLPKAKARGLLHQSATDGKWEVVQ